MDFIIEQAGAVTFRIFESGIKFLLVRSKKEPSKRIFPKGHVEFGETLEETSLRELKEESGVTGEIVTYLDTVEFSKVKKKYRVSYFLYKFNAVVGTGEAGREPHWYDYETAMDLIVFPSSRYLLELSKKTIEKLKLSQ